MRGVVTVMTLICLIILTGCTTIGSHSYPWHGPITDPDGNPPPEPHYETIAR